MLQEIVAEAKPELRESGNVSAEGRRPVRGRQTAILYQ
jgi:hypothetical protein